MTRLEKWLSQPIAKNRMTRQEAIAMTILVVVVLWMIIRRH